jgi:metal-sulfur cluster biosynthetic enzyme
MSGLPYPYEGPPELADVFLRELRQVIDPEVGLDIVAVGLVYGVRVVDGLATVDVTMTSAACPMADMIIDDIENRLDEALPPELKIHVELVWEPEWTPDRLSEDGRKAMGW